MADEADSALIERVFHVTLLPERAGVSADPPTVHLADLAQEVQGQLLRLDLLDRIVVARLIESPPASYPQAPLPYLLGCFARAVSEQRSRAAQESPRILSLATACRELIVSYAMLCLLGVVPQSRESEARGALQLLDSIDAKAAASAGNGLHAGAQAAAASAAPATVPMSPGFMEDFAAKHEKDGLDTVLAPIVKELARRVRATSPLGDYHTPLSIVGQLVKCEPMARVLVKLREWLPNLKDVTGRGIELPGSSWLGPCFSVSPIPDDLTPAQPSVLQQCFSNADERRPADLSQSISALRMASRQIQGEQHAIVKALLGKSTREPMVSWLAAVLDGNAERSKLILDPQRAASHGFFINLNAVMLKLCSPFMDPSSPNFWAKVDSHFVTVNNRLPTLASETKLAMTAQEEAAWKERVTSSLATSSSGGGGGGGAGPGAAPEYHFICECFFMTAHALHLGIVKVINDRLHRAQYTLPGFTGQLEDVEQELARIPSGSRRETELRRAQVMLKEAVNKEKAFQLAAECVAGDADFMGEVLAFYRLLAIWMISVACPQCNRNLSAIQLPLPTPPPPEFACLPEYFVEDITDVLLHVNRFNPMILGSARMDEIMLFLVVFMGSPAYVKSSHLRSKLSDVLHAWLPPEEEAPTLGVRPMSARRLNPRQQLGSNLAVLFQGHPMVLTHMVPTLLRLYVDVEFTDQHNAFYMKFNLRQRIAEVLHYLWKQPAHKEVWRAFARSEAGTGTGDYVRFCNMLIGDSIYLLDESLKLLKETKEREGVMADPARWLALTPQEQQEMQSEHGRAGDRLKFMLQLAQGAIHLMSFTTEEITAPFLLPEMVDRLASMLNYFLKYLTGSERRSLAIKDPEKYNFRPRELLLSIIKVYLHMSTADRSGTFARAVAADERSYMPQMFPESQRVLQSSDLLDHVQRLQLEQLARQVEDARSSAQEQDDLLADVETPAEFLDPLMATLMVDPVQLPTSSRLIMDRAHIVRHLLSDQRDPSTREPLLPEDLVPLPDLKARIQAWVAQTVAAKRAERARNAMQE